MIKRNSFVQIVFNDMHLRSSELFVERRSYATLAIQKRSKTAPYTTADVKRDNLRARGKCARPSANENQFLYM